MKKKYGSIEKDIRVKSRRFSWKQFWLAFAILVGLALTQSLIMGTIFNNAMLSEVEVSLYLILIVGLWAIVAVIYIIMQHRKIIRKFDIPLQKLCEATQKVAQGDFSVYLASEHKQNKRDYVDVTYENFNMMVKELSSIETMKSSFIADVSHELKTPLSVIQNYGMAMQKSELSEAERMEYAQTVVEATQKLTTLITNILKLNKLENQELVPESKKFDLSRQLSDCILAFSGKLEEKDIEFEALMDDNCEVFSDEGMLSIVWQNLLSNAIKFTESGGRITITQKQTEKQVSVTVVDTGCGMSEETMKRVFDKFYQGDTSHSTEGNGLGLALCLKAINLVGGEIKVKSEIRKGSSFTVTLPKERNH